MKVGGSRTSAQGSSDEAGLAAWLLRKLRRRFTGGGRELPRLALLDRIALAPRQSLALVEVEGRKFLVATSPEGGPAFCALDRAPRQATDRPASVSTKPSARPATTSVSTRPSARLSW